MNEEHTVTGFCVGVSNEGRVVFHCHVCDEVFALDAPLDQVGKAWVRHMETEHAMPDPETPPKPKVSISAGGMNWNITGVGK